MRSVSAGRTTRINVAVASKKAHPADRSQDNLVVHVCQISGYITLTQKHPSMPWYLLLPVNISRDGDVILSVIASSCHVTLDNQDKTHDVIVT